MSVEPHAHVHKKKKNIDTLWVRIFLNFSESNYRCLLIKKRDSEGKVLEMELGILKFFSTDIFSPTKANIEIFKIRICAIATTVCKFLVKYSFDVVSIPFALILLFKIVYVQQVTMICLLLFSCKLIYRMVGLAFTKVLTYPFTRAAI